MEKLAQLRAQRATLLDELQDIAVTGTAEQYDEKKCAFDDVAGRIERAQAAQTLAATLARPIDADLPAANLNVPEAVRAANPFLMRSQFGRVPNLDAWVRHARGQMGFVNDNSKHFRNFGEQLQAVAAFSNSRGSTNDPRLVRAPAESLSRAPTGGGEVDPTGGGFLVQTDFATAIFMLAHDEGELLGRVNKLPISEHANGIKIPAVDESSRANGSRWGGVQSYWVDEGTAPASTRPSFRMVELDLKKLMSTMYVSNELLMDSTALGSIAGIAFSEEIVFNTEDAIFEGSGSGQPFGYMNSPALVTVAKQQGQGAGSIVKENIDAMWSRLWARSRKNAIWTINQDCEPQLNSLNQAVGTGGQLVYLPPGGISAAPYATLYGRPLVVTEYNNTTGTPGDITLVDLSQYTVIDKGGVQAAWSMHVAFLSDQQVFRITYRVDGKPMWHVPLTPFKGSNSHSPFVALAGR